MAISRWLGRYVALCGSLLIACSVNSVTYTPLGDRDGGAQASSPAPDAASTQTCGNGIVDPGEQCDDGTNNGQPGSACDVTCHIVENLCGNGVVDRGEQCDPGPNDSATCNSVDAGAVACQFARCGDGYINRAAGEQCELTADCSPGKTCQACRCQ
jgi:cysteine-rich repeat protein